MVDSRTAQEAGLTVGAPKQVETPADVVYEDVLDKLLATLRENILARVDSYGMPALDEVPKAVKTRLAWMKATEDDLALTAHQTLFGSADDLERRKQLWDRVGECWVDMAAWMVHRAVRDEHPMARTLKELAADEKHAKEK